MQYVKHEQGYSNIHWLLDDIERLYAEISDRTFVQNSAFPLTYDSSFHDLLDVLYVFGGIEFPDNIEEPKDIKPIEVPTYNPKNIIVCFSGGKDSFSVLRHYMKMGYNVYPFHIRGLNKVYLDEWKIAEEACNQLGLKLHIETIKLSGNHKWIEHPMKNMLMLNMALHYGVSKGITTKIATGNFRTSSLFNSPFDVCGGDAMDMWETYVQIVKRIIPKFKLYVPNLNYETAFKALQKEPQYIPYTISCITPNRFRGEFRQRTMKNYNIDLMQNRCGCCWKCAVEYMWLADANILDYNESYYLHCIEVLANTIEKETGHCPNNVNFVWGEYMFYPMNKSKAYKELQNAIIYARKIKRTNNIVT